MFTPERALQIVKQALGSVQQVQQIKELQILSIRPWAMGALVAENLQPVAGVFLAGDSAHQLPPAGGFGMNTGIQVGCCTYTGCCTYGVCIHIHATGVAVVNTAWSLSAIVTAELCVHSCLVALALLLL
jgi:FAD binding domain